MRYIRRKWRESFHLLDTRHPIADMLGGREAEDPEGEVVQCRVGGCLDELVLESAASGINRGQANRAVLDRPGPS